MEQVETIHIADQDHRYDSYIQQLKKRGAQISCKLQCGFFTLKNGLKYPGMGTKQAVEPTQILVRLPVQLLLTSHRACRQNELQQIYKDSFYYSGPIWQDRVLITYLLYVLAQQKDNIWSIMASYFPKQVDIISFWSDKDLEKFADKSVKHAAQLQRKNFENQWECFQQAQSKYPILRLETFTKQNYSWIYTHTVSRCFGAFLNSTYFVPFCQFFNHNCINISYECIEKIEQSQPVYTETIDSNNTKQSNSNILGTESLQQPNLDQQQSISSISQCSDDSEDYIGDGDYSYHQIPTYSINWCSKTGFNLKNKEIKIIQQKCLQILQYLNNNIQWRGLSLKYIGQIMQKTNLIKNQYMAQRKKYQQAYQQLETLYYHAANFLKQVKYYYQQHGCSYKTRKSGTNKQSNKHSQQTECKTELKNGELQKDEQDEGQRFLARVKQQKTSYKYFQMVTHSNFKRIQKHQQIYFEYGRLSNRTLLLRYGFALENNRYEHVWVRQKLQIPKCLSEYPDLFNKIKERGLPIVHNIKLKPYVLNTQIITFKKMQTWKLYSNFLSSHANRDFQQIFGITNISKQQTIIQQVIDIYQDNIQLYGKQVQLTDSTLSYHQYFIGVYHNDKLAILNLQISLLKCMLKMLGSLEHLTRQQRNKNFWRFLNEFFPKKQDRKMVYHYARNLKDKSSRQYKQKREQNSIQCI